MLCWPKLKYIYNMTKFIDDVIILSIHKETSTDSTYCFHYTIQQPIGATWCIPEETLSLENRSSCSTPSSSNINHICTPRNGSQPYIGNIFLYSAVNGSLVPAKNVNIPPQVQFGDMYTIEFTGVKSKMVQCWCFLMAPETMTNSSP